MRIRVIQKPSVARIDGIRVDQFIPGQQYEVGNVIGALFLSEGWAEPVPSDEPAVLVPFSELDEDDDNSAPPNLTREYFPPYYDAPSALTADRRRRSRGSRMGIRINKIK